MPLEYALQFRGRFPDPGPWKLPKSVPVKLTQDLGISELPAQRVRRSKRLPYVFNIMVVGESGLGKTTFINTLFNASLNDHKEKNLSSNKTVNIVPNTFELQEDGVTLHLTVVDTPGFGDQLNRESSFTPIVSYIDEQYSKYLQAERSQEMRRDIVDTRIHAMIYFIPPTGGNKLKDLDVEFLQRLCTKVNIIPVIGKADSLTREETFEFKKSLLQAFDRHDIRAYPTFHADEREAISHLEKHMPFAVVGSDDFIDVGEKKVRGRKYRWGNIQVENKEHCDFVYLRELLIQTNLQDLIESTHVIHYAAYRSSQIQSKERPESFLACDDMYDARIETAKRTIQVEMSKKEDAMREMFVVKVKEKEAELRAREEKLTAKRQQMVEELERLRQQIAADEAIVQELSQRR